MWILIVVLGIGGYIVYIIKNKKDPFQQKALQIKQLTESSENIFNLLITEVLKMNEDLRSMEKEDPTSSRIKDTIKENLSQIENLKEVRNKYIKLLAKIDKSNQDAVLSLVTDWSIYINTIHEQQDDHSLEGQDIVGVATRARDRFTVIKEIREKFEKQLQN